jgi:hypothetical protein
LLNLGSNNTQVLENVAFNTAGHCFVLEDGIEFGNVFIRNLGLVTRKPAVLIPNIPSAMNGKETDDMVSTFWITNLRNTFIGNVAAGSEDTGFWFELLKRGIYKDVYQFDQFRQDLLLFQDNTAHSNMVSGIDYVLTSIHSLLKTSRYYICCTSVCSNKTTGRIPDVSTIFLSTEPSQAHAFKIVSEPRYGGFLPRCEKHHNRRQFVLGQCCGH